jgi:hypothetical protein
MPPFFQIYTNALLTAIVLHEIAAAPIPYERKGPSWIALGCELHFDNLGTHLSHHERAGWTGDELREIQNLEAIKHMRRLIHCDLLNLVAPFLPVPVTHLTTLSFCVPPNVLHRLPAIGTRAISAEFATFRIIASAFQTGHWLPALLVGEFVEQCFRVFEVGGVEALGEPVVDVGEHRARLIAATSLRCEQSR